MCGGGVGIVTHTHHQTHIIYILIYIFPIDGWLCLCDGCCLYAVYAYMRMACPFIPHTYCTSPKNFWPASMSDTKTNNMNKKMKQKKDKKKKVKKVNVGAISWVLSEKPIVSQVVAEILNVNVGTTDVTLQPRDSRNQEAVFVAGNGDSVFGDLAIARYMIRTSSSSTSLLGTNPLEASQIDQWIDFVNSRKSSQNLSVALAAVNLHLKTRNFLVGGFMSLADVAMCASISSLNDTSFLESEYVDVSRWFNTVSSSRYFKIASGKLNSSLKCAHASLKKQLREKTTKNALMKQSKSTVKSVGKMSQGAMPDLEGVDKLGGPTKVVTRFPPEPSGYMHIGHVKAATLNHYYAKIKYKGKLVIRMDDTNPNNEKGEYVLSLSLFSLCLLST